MQFINTLYRYPRTSALLAGAIATLAMAPWNITPALLTLSVLVLLVAREERPLRGALYLFLFGMSYFVVGLYWVQYAFSVSVPQWPALRFVALVGLPLLLMPGWLFAGYLAVRFTAFNTLARGIAIVTLLALAEYGRAFIMTGFPWNNFAYSWISVPQIAQISSIMGMYALNALTIMWFATPALAWLMRGHRQYQTGLVVFTLVTLVSSFAYGTWRLNTHPTVLRDDVSVVAVQPNIDQHEKWDPEKIPGHFIKHITLSQTGLSQVTTGKSILLVWPETAVEDLFLQARPDLVHNLMDLLSKAPLKTRLITGFMRGEGVGDTARYYNSIAVLDIEDGRLTPVSMYDKAHLVPFGEYLPLEKLLGLKALTGFSGFESGPGPKTLTATDMPPAAPIVCYEAIYPWAVHSKSAEWIVNVSNDGWYGDTSGPYQHLVATQFRAIEQGRPVIRSTTTGMSAVIDSYGRVLQTIPYGQDGVLVSLLPASAPAPLYTHMHEWLLFAILALGAFFAGYLRLKNR